MAVADIPDEGTRDTRMVERAIRERWDIPPEVRKMLGTHLARIAFNMDSDGKAGEGGYKPREQTAASRALIQMMAQNQSDEHRDKAGPNLNLNLTAEELAEMSDEQLEQYIERLTTASGRTRKT